MKNTDYELRKLEAIENVKVALAKKGIDYDSSYKCTLLKDRFELYKRVKKKSINKRLSYISKEYM